MAAPNKILLFLLLLLGPLSGYTQPPTNNANEQLALQAFNNKEFDKAIVYYEKLYDKNPSAYY